MPSPPVSTPARPRETETLKSLLAKPATIDRLAAIAPKYLSPDRLIRILLLTVSRDSKLWKCTPQSLLAALMRVAQYGLEPDGRLVHLVPYKDVVQVIVDWKGLIEIARRNGITAVANLVYVEDDFELILDNGSGRTIYNHKADPRKSRTDILGAYSRIHPVEKPEQVDYEWMSIDEIEAIRKRSQAANSGPWVSDFGEMARKTVLRRHSKRWPLCSEDRVATEDDDAPTEILARRAEVSSEPARPVFKGRSAIDDADDLSFDGSTSSEAEIEATSELSTKTEPTMKPEPPRTQRTRRAKVDPALPAKTEAQPEGEADTGSNTELQDKLQAWVEVDRGSDFLTFQKAIIELNWIETASSWKGFLDVPDEAAAKLLNAHKVVGRAIEMVKGGEA